MTAEEFRARLEALGLSHYGFARAVSGAGGEELSPHTVRNWANGHRGIPPTVPALLSLLASQPQAVEADRHLAQGSEHDRRDDRFSAPDGDHDPLHPLASP